VRPSPRPCPRIPKSRYRSRRTGSRPDAPGFPGAPTANHPGDRHPDHRTRFCRAIHPESPGIGAIGPEQPPRLEGTISISSSTVSVCVVGVVCTRAGASNALGRGRGAWPPRASGCQGANATRA